MRIEKRHRRADRCSHLLPLGVLCSMLCPSHIFVAVVGEQNPERCIGDYARQRGAFAVVQIIV